MERKLYRIARTGFVLTAIFLCASLAWVPAAAELSILPGGAIIEYSGDPDTPVIEVTVDIGMVAGDEETPRLRIYGDGRLHVHFPPGMKRSGNYHMQLGDTQMADILISLSDKGLMTFDEREARQAIREAKEQRSRAPRAKGQVLPKHRAEGTRTTITINLSQFKARGADQPTVSGFSHSISWHGTRSDAQNFPEIEEIANLFVAQQELLGLCNAPGLQKIDN